MPYGTIASSDYISCKDNRFVQFDPRLFFGPSNAGCILLFLFLHLAPNQCSQYEKAQGTDSREHSHDMPLPPLISEFRPIRRGSLDAPGHYLAVDRLVQKARDHAAHYQTHDCNNQHEAHRMIASIKYRQDDCEKSANGPQNRHWCIKSSDSMLVQLDVETGR